MYSAARACQHTQGRTHHARRARSLTGTARGLVRAWSQRMDTTRLMPHKFSLIFPDADAATFQSLMKNMREHGWNPEYPIVTFRGMVLDGRNRLRAAKETKVEPTFKEFNGTDDDALKYVVTANLHRRHLSQSERAIVAAELLEIESGLETVRQERNIAPLANGIQIKQRSGSGREKALAASLGVSPRLIDEARELRRTDRRAFEAIKQAGKTMPKANGSGRERAPKTVSGALKKAKAEAERRAAPAQPEPERDDAGHAIHPKAAKALGDGRERFKALIRQLHAAKREAIALAGDALGRLIHKQTVETDFENIARQLRFAAPYSSCPLGDPCGAGCKLCRGTQWIGEGQYEGMPKHFKERKS